MLSSMADAGNSLGMPMMGVVTRTISVCSVSLLPLLVVFLITLLTFSMIAHLTFGLSLEEFRTPLTSMGEVCLMLMGGGLDSQDFAELCYNSGESEFCYANVYLFFWMFVLINSILLLNMVLAMVFGVYDQVREEITAENKDTVSVSILNSFAIVFHLVEPKTVIQDGKINFEEVEQSENSCIEMESLLAKDVNQVHADNKDSEISELKRTVGDLNVSLNLLRESMESMKSELKADLSILHQKEDPQLHNDAQHVSPERELSQSLDVQPLKTREISSRRVLRPKLQGPARRSKSMN
uniref:Polycystin cation channel PKD1/PKD2 domain-containing protein n=1 Tax=Octactis speculum TaxID=3111310 RepID=A0A7S2FL75_9STRA